MNLAHDIYSHLETIPWFSTVGQEPSSQFDFPVTYAESGMVALNMFNSSLWSDVKTEAQGDLTGYLAKHQNSAYGGYWNNLAKQSRALVEATIKVKLADALSKRSFPVEMIQPILVDVNRAALEIAYRRKFPKVPVFFERLLKVYESGRLPCGWSGTMSNWPVGNIIIF